MRKSGEYSVVSGEWPVGMGHSPLTTRHSVLHLAWMIVLLLTTIAPLRAQDIHFSQFFQTPLALGPGSIGLFDGDYRANGIFRQQWRSVSVPYRTFAAGGDAANFRGIKGLGVGAWLFNDRAGDSRLNQFHLNLGASWTTLFGSGKKHGITAGVQLGFTSLSLDRGDLSFDSQYNGFYYDPSLGNGENFARDGLTHADLRAGAAYRYRIAERKMVQLGFGLFNLTRPRIGFLGEPGVPLDTRTSIHAITQFPVHERFDVLPMAQFMTQGKFRETDVGANLRYILLERYGLKRSVMLGLHFRAEDAGYVFAGFEHDDWTFGISYDINTSDLVPASRNRGGIEFTVVRIWRKRPAVPVRFKACPDQL